MKKLIIIGLLVGIVWFTMSNKKPNTVDNLKAAAAAETMSSTESANAFKCDGRTHCSQMKSCEEATFFIKNCPNTQMDGDNDGTPCESQWCN